MYILFLCLFSLLQASYVHLLVAYFTSCHHCKAVSMSYSMWEAYIDTAFFLSQLEGCQLLKTLLSHKTELLQVTFDNTTLQYYSQQSWSRCQYFAQKVLYQLQTMGLGNNVSRANNVTIQVHGSNIMPDNVTDITTNKTGNNFSLFVLIMLSSTTCFWMTCWCRLRTTWILRSTPTVFLTQSLLILDHKFGQGGQFKFGGTKLMRIWMNMHDFLALQDSGGAVYSLLRAGVLASWAEAGRKESNWNVVLYLLFLLADRSPDNSCLMQFDCWEASNKPNCIMEAWQLSCKPRNHDVFCKKAEQHLISEKRAFACNSWNIVRQISVILAFTDFTSCMQLDRSQSQLPTALWFVWMIPFHKMVEFQVLPQLEVLFSQMKANACTKFLLSRELFNAWDYPKVGITACIFCIMTNGGNDSALDYVLHVDRCKAQVMAVFCGSVAML